MPLLEHHFTCPCCFANISMLIDISISQQEYIEDCEVCCRPLDINLEVLHGEVINFAAQPSGD